MGTATDGLCLSGTYTPGTEYARFSIASLVTTVGTGGKMGRGPRS